MEKERKLLCHSRVCIGDDIIGRGPDGCTSLGFGAASWLITGDNSDNSCIAGVQSSAETVGGMGHGLLFFSAARGCMQIPVWEDCNLEVIQLADPNLYRVAVRELELSYHTGYI